MKIWGPLSRLGLATAAITLAADQLHKWWMLEVFRIGEKGKVTVAPFLDLVLVWNRGISYGLLQQEGSGQLVLAGIAAVASILLAWWLAHLDTRLPALSVGLIIGGAIGNAIDRLQYGAVADFFSLYVAGFHWPYIFNIADVAIVAGVAGLLYDSLKSSHKSAGKQI